MAPAPLLARTHLILGAITLAAFLLSGFYMLEHDPPLSKLEPGLHLMFDQQDGVSCLFVGTALHLGTGLRGRLTTTA